MATKVTKKKTTVVAKGQDENLKKMTVKELKERLNAYGLDATGLKPELLKRLETFLTSSMMQTTTNGSGDDDDDGENDLNIETLRDEAKKKAEDAIAKFEIASLMKNKEEDDEDEKPRKRVITDEDHLPTNVAAEEEKKSGKKRGRGGGALASASSSRRRKVRTIVESDEEEEEDEEDEEEEEDHQEEEHEKKRRRDGGKSKKRRGKKEYEDEDEDPSSKDAVEYESTKSIPCVGNEGRIIGKGGAKIRELQVKYEVVIQLNRENGCVEIMGNRTNVLECEVEILRITEEGTARNAEKEKQLQNQGRGGQHHQRGERGGRGEEKRGGGDRGGGQGREEIPCAGMEGRIIGKGGETIRRLEADSGARVRINRERLVCEISGEPGCVETAVRLVHELMASSGADRGGGGGQQGRQQQQNVYGGQAFGLQQHQIYGQPAAATAATTTQVYGAAAATYGQPAASSHVATAVAPVYGQQQQYSYGTQQQVYGQATAPTSSAAPVYGQQVYGQQVQQVAPPPVARHHPISSLPPDWEEVNQDGQIYYWNTRTNLTQYERPV